MKYTDVHPGDQVLYYWARPSHRHWRLDAMEQAVVLETGVRHHYEVEPSGWGRQSSGDLKRVTGQGIRLRVTRHDRTPRVAGQTGLLPETYETVTIAAHLLPGNGEAAARWEELRGVASAKDAARTARMAAAAELRMRFADAGFEVTGGDEYVIFKGADAERLLAALAAPGEQAVLRQAAAVLRGRHAWGRVADELDIIRATIED